MGMRRNKALALLAGLALAFGSAAACGGKGNNTGGGGTTETGVVGKAKKEGKVDLVVATYTINDDRKKKVNFAGPYYVAGQDLLVKVDNTTITGPDSLDGKKVCSVTGSTPAKRIQTEHPKAALQLFDSYSKCVEALAQGSVDAVTTDDIILAGYAAQSQFAGKLKVVGKPFSTEPNGIGLKKEDKSSCDKINEILKAAAADGRYKAAWDATKLTNCA